MARQHVSITRRKGAFPQVRVVALAECGTHVMFTANIGTYAGSEAALTEPLLDWLAPGMLLTAPLTTLTPATAAGSQPSAVTPQPGSPLSGKHGPQS